MERSKNYLTVERKNKPTRAYAGGKARNVNGSPTRDERRCSPRKKHREANYYTVLLRLSGNHDGLIGGV